MSSTTIDHLEEDNSIPNQNYVCLSFVSPEGIKGCDLRALKVRGVYPTYDLAQERAKELQEKDGCFNIFIGEVGKWLPWDPNPHEGAKDQVYYEEQMQELIAGYKENIKNSKKEVMDRAEACRNSRVENTNARKSKVVERMQKKLANQDKNLPTNVEDMTTEQKIKRIEELSKQ